MSVLVAVVVLIVSSYHCVKMDEYQCIGKDTKTIVDRCKSCFAACSDWACRPFGPVQALSRKPGTAGPTANDTILYCILYLVPVDRRPRNF